MGPRRVLIRYDLADGELYLLHGFELAAGALPEQQREAAAVIRAAVSLDEARAVLCHQNPSIERCLAALHMRPLALERLMSAKHAANMKRIARTLIPELRNKARVEGTPLHILRRVCGASEPEEQLRRWNDIQMGAASHSQPDP